HHVDLAPSGDGRPAVLGNDHCNPCTVATSNPRAVSAATSHRSARVGWAEPAPWTHGRPDGGEGPTDGQTTARGHRRRNDGEWQPTARGAGSATAREEQPPAAERG